jgi:Baseplate J-like protein
MALISPILDDRSYDQLREELLRRIPVYAPEWTNHNESDPGVALLDLIAYLGESLLYRFNQIPETTRTAFLRLLGVDLRPAIPATALLGATTEIAGGMPIERGAAITAGDLTFQTTGATQVWPLTCIAAGKVGIDPPGGPVTLSRADDDRRADALVRAKVTTGQKPLFYATVEVSGDPMAQDATDVAVSKTADRSLWIAVLRTRTTDLTVLINRSLFVGFAFDEQIPVPFTFQPNNDDYRSVNLDGDLAPMLWELWNPPIGPADKPTFVELAVGDDSTRGLTTTGVVEVLLPDTALPKFDPTARTSGNVDNPPPLNDEKQAADVIAWLRVSRPRPTDYPRDAIGIVRWVGLNACLATHSRATPPELLGLGTGDAGQQYPVTQSPVLPNTMRLQVEEPDGWNDWVEVPAYAESRPDDRHYVVDYAAGSVRFPGPKVPQIGERIRTLTYRHGGGTRGNVDAGKLKVVSGVAGVKVRNPLAANGGADAATWTEALAAIPAEVHRKDRAVVADDFRALTTAVVGVSRAEVVPLMHPDTPTVDTPGVVSVIVWPDQDLRNPAAPSPDKGLLRRIARHLDARRLVTTELYVIPPTYRPVCVSVGVSVRSGYQVDAVRRWVDKILGQYLSPLPPYGPDGQGWPCGRTVRRAELEAVAVQVEGVDYATGLLLSLPPASGGGQPPIDELALDRWEVPELVELTVVANQLPLAPGTTNTPEPPEGDDVFVPLPPEVC